MSAKFPRGGSRVFFGRQSINGINSDSIPVSSGVPQGAVLRHILFLAYINDLPDQVKSHVRLFADDTGMYLAITSLSETEILQQDLITGNLEHWKKHWDMNSKSLKMPGHSCDLA